MNVLFPLFPYTDCISCFDHLTLLSHRSQLESQRQALLAERQAFNATRLQAEQVHVNLHPPSLHCTSTLTLVFVY